jgi:error-prone DNA polymerase
MPTAASASALPEFAELHCLSNFSFQRGASSAQELFERAAKLGYQALAITDEASLSGIVRALEAAEQSAAGGAPIKLIVGAEFRLVCGLKLAFLVRNLAGYTQLCQFITHARRATGKGRYQADRAMLERCLAEPGGADNLVAILLPDAHTLWQAQQTADRETLAIAIIEQLRWLKLHITEVRLAISLHQTGRDGQTLALLQQVAIRAEVIAVACNDVHMHARSRRPLQDVLTAIALGVPVAQAGLALFPNAERHLRTRAELAVLYPPELLQASVDVAKLCDFSLRSLQYRYPSELAPAGFSASAWLAHLTAKGQAKRWPNGTEVAVQKQIDYELKLIAELGYESYFLTVHDIVAFARQRGILCQGRGSAANSAVCYCLGITEVDPARGNMLFERFISKERNEPPDIDVDFEHQRREEVFQYIYQKYGRERAALAATVICYRQKSAVRDVAKALGFAHDQLDELTRALAGWRSDLETGEADESGAEPAQKPPDFGARLRELGFDPDSSAIKKLRVLSQQIMGFPRHLSQHVGGFVISEANLATLVPVENAAMPDRTILQWDKDDLDTLGLLKVDCLALGMLSCIRRCLTMLGMQDLADIPAEDPATYQMIQKGDTLGVFQIESRAQMAMLPRLKPANFYDLVIEVAIVRPGPIQGKMVHPYLRRRQGLEPVSYPSEDLKRVFERTLGVPIFQEQVMQLAIVAAGFTPGEADQLRRSMAAWKRRGGLEHYRDRILDGMRERGYELSFAEQVFEQIKGFGAYGFPESHAASFALLVYASCYLKCHYPAQFACALLNSQPMGFYLPAQIIADVKAHHIQVLPVDVQVSGWLSRVDTGALRLGLHLVSGLQVAAGLRIETARQRGPFASIAELSQRADLDAGTRAKLAKADALHSIVGNRHQANWASAAIQLELPLHGFQAALEDTAELPAPMLAAEVYADYQSLGLSLKAHPMSLIRPQLQKLRYSSSAALIELGDKRSVRTAGLVTLRQRPGTASGVTFVTLEDEFGLCNIVVWRTVYEAQRRVLLESNVLGVDGVLESHDGVRHVIAHRLHGLDHMLPRFEIDSRDFR